MDIKTEMPQETLGWILHYAKYKWLRNLIILSVSLSFIVWFFFILHTKTIETERSKAETERAKIESKILELERKKVINEVFSELWDRGKNENWKIELLKIWPNPLSISEKIWWECLKSENWRLHRAAILCGAPSSVLERLKLSPHEIVSGLSKLALINWDFSRYQFDSKGINKSLSKIPNLSEHQIDRLLNLNDSDVNIEIAGKQSLSEAQFNRLFKSSKLEVKEALFSNKYLEKNQIDKLFEVINFNDVQMIKPVLELASFQPLTKEQIDKLLDFRNPNTAEQIPKRERMEGILYDCKNSIPYALFKNPNLSEDQYNYLRTLFRENNDCLWPTRGPLPNSPNLTDAQFDELLETKDLGFLRSLSLRKNLSKEQYNKIAQLNKTMEDAILTIRLYRNKCITPDKFDQLMKKKDPIGRKFLTFLKTLSGSKELEMRLKGQDWSVLSEMASYLKLTNEQFNKLLALRNENGNNDSANPPILNALARNENLSEGQMDRVISLSLSNGNWLAISTLLNNSKMKKKEMVKILKNVDPQTLFHDRNFFHDVAARLIYDEIP